MSRGEPIYWLGKVGNCDMCGTDLSVLPSFADCVINRQSWLWGLVCTHCVESRGLRVTLGLGQLYMKSEEGSVTCIAGAIPTAKAIF